MKLGSIVGLIIAGILIVSGIITCAVGSSSAKASGEYLFTQKNDDGTYYTESISEETTKLSLRFENADVTINGGAEKSSVEFINFNPNLYSLSTTRNVITFDEIGDFDSIKKIWESGITFKGLRYLLDFRNFEYADAEKSIVINLADNSELKILSITSERSDITLQNLSINGDIYLSITEGVITVNSLKTDSTLSLSGKDIKASVSDTAASDFRYTADNGELTVKGSSFTDAQLTSLSGRIDYYANTNLNKEYVNLSSENGGMLINDTPNTGMYVIENDEFDCSLKIKTTSAGINLVYPTEEE